MIGSMGRKNEPDYDAEFRDITRHLGDVDRTLSPAGSGPRDWVPAESPDEVFDPADLPELNESFMPGSTQSAGSAGAHSVWAPRLLICALVLGILALLGYIHVLPVPQIGGIAAIAALICVAGSIFASLPRHRDPDDDGARL